jgi:hypothetical protein
MIIPKADRRTIYENLFKEGVLVAKKDFNAPKHQDLDVKNLFVIKACQSLTSKGFLTTHFSWQYYYVRPSPPSLCLDSPSVFPKTDSLFRLYSTSLPPRVLTTSASTSTSPPR